MTKRKQGPASMVNEGRLLLGASPFTALLTAYLEQQSVATSMLTLNYTVPLATVQEGCRLLNQGRNSISVDLASSNISADTGSNGLQVGAAHYKYLQH